MWELDHNKSWALKSWYFWSVVFEKTLESPLDFREIQPVNSKGNQSLLFIERTDAEAEASILWPPNMKNWLIGKDPDARKDGRQEEKGMREDEMVGWHHHFDGCEFEHVLEWWWTGKPGVLQSMGSQRVSLSDWETELNCLKILTHHTRLPNNKIFGMTWKLSFQECQWAFKLAAFNYFDHLAGRFKIRNSLKKKHTRKP